MDKTTITAVREAIKGDALTDAVKEKLDEIEAFYEEASAIKSKAEDLQKDNEKLQIKFMAEKGRRESAESVIEDLKEMSNENDKKLKKYDELVSKVDELKSENENLQSLKVEQETKIRNEYQALIDKHKDAEAFEKWKDEFVLPSEEKKLEDMSIDEIKASKERFDKLIERGVFGAVDTRIAGEQTQDIQKLNDLEEQNKVRKTMGLPPLKK